jgi:glyoxylase-like metal-dependent hydrolase (beta-lactamase superfamily II)
MLRPLLSLDETAARRIERLGFAREDVRHVFVTHLDSDHAGGLADFPEAQVHVLEAEYQAAMSPRSAMEKQRYRPAQWRHGPRWVRHTPGGERWFGFRSVRAIDERTPEVLVIPLEGHTRGHAAVAVADGKGGWVLHAGDSYFHRAEMDTPPSCPRILDMVQKVDEEDAAARRWNQERLRYLARAEKERVRIFCAHDPVELARMQAARD